MSKERKKLESNQVLGPDIMNFLAVDKGIKDNMSNGAATVGAATKAKGPGKHFGDE